MSMYNNNRHAAESAVAAAAAASAAHEAAAIHAQYRPDEAMLNGVSSDGMHYGAFLDPRDSFSQQGAVYYPPPQAPRLSAAAARASHFAAMYYDPSLHPQHAFSSNAQVPWATSYYGEYQPGIPEYNPVSTVQHQDLEQQLIRQNQMMRISQTPQQADQRHSRFNTYDNSLQDAYVPSARGSGELGWNTWGPFYGQQQQQPGNGYVPSGSHGQVSSAYGPQLPPSQTEYIPRAGYDAEMFPTAPATDAHIGARHSLGSSREVWPQDATRAVWNPAQWNRSLHSQAHRSSSQDVTRGAWQPPQGRHDTAWGQNLSWRNAVLHTKDASGTWQHGPQSYVPASQPASQPANHFANEVQSIWGNPPDGMYIPQAHAPAQVDAYHLAQQQQGVHLAQQDVRQPDYPAPEAGPAATQNTSGAPAPPSPNTLDKSAVPLTALGAEIVWVAAAAMLDPALLQIFKLRSMIADQSHIPGRSSIESSPNTSPDVASTPAWTHRVNDNQAISSPSIFNVDALKADLMEDSSASSSEPSTPPPATAPARQERSKPYGAVSPRNGMLPALDVFSDQKRPRPFYRSASHDRAKTAVDGIAELISPAWRWSTNDDKLVSLRKSNDAIVGPHSHASSPRVCKNSPREDNNSQMPGGVPMSGTDPSPAFRRFANQVLAQTLVSPTAFMLSLLYSLRVLQLALVEGDANSDSHLDPEAIEIFAQPPSAAPFKLFTLGLMIANKHLDDNTFLNKTWNEVTGITLVELNRMERWYLEKCSYEITIPCTTWVSFLERLRLRNETRLSALRDQRVGSVASLPPFNRSTSQIEALRRQPMDQQDANRKSHAAIMRPYRSGSGSNTSHGAPAVGSSSSLIANEETLKRFLSDTEDALLAMGKLPPFDLSSSVAW